MATTAIVLNTTYKLPNGEYSVALRVTHERKPKHYSISSLIVDNSLAFKCSTEHWKIANAEDNGLGKFRKSFKQYKQCNAILEAKLKETNAILKKYDEQGFACPYLYFHYPHWG